MKPLNKKSGGLRSTSRPLSHQKPAPYKKSGLEVSENPYIKSGIGLKTLKQKSEVDWSVSTKWCKTLNIKSETLKQKSGGLQSTSRPLSHQNPAPYKKSGLEVPENPYIKSRMGLKTLKQKSGVDWYVSTGWCQTLNIKRKTLKQKSEAILALSGSRPHFFC